MKAGQLKKLFNKLIDLTKQIYLQEPPDNCVLPSRFLAGKRPRIFLGSLGLEWWVTKRAHKCCEEIADMAISFEPQLQGGDRAEFCKIINTSLQENATNPKIFNVDSLVFRQVNNLFEARAVKEVRDFASSLWSEISENLIKSIADWMILYPLRQIKVQSFVLNFDGLSLLASNDKNRWQELSENYKVKTWDPSTGIWKDKSEKSSWKDFVFVPSWLVCEISGTKSGARYIAGRRMRSFVAILFSYLDKQYTGLLLKSGADVASYSIQFPNKAAKINIRWEVASIGELLPPLLLNIGTQFIDVPDEAVSKVKNWYTQRSSVPELAQQRATTASHFTHRAVMFDELDRFLYFFVTLDALFGERHKVEKNIREGIKRTFPNDSIWEKRIEEIFDLRNELVHGGISSLSDWNRLDHYREYFQSHPLEDVKTAAMTALTTYFQYQSYEVCDNDKQ
ncbi:MAG: hypothetical protein F6K16_27975 [Symploca sp. SIO2B6]|nr:hypothetical protein [Symploca sp. SIO2B6]